MTQQAASVPTGEFDDEADTGAVDDPLLKLDRRSKNTSIAVKAARTELASFSRRFDERDVQNKIDHTRFERSIDNLSTDVRQLNGHVGALREDNARTEGKIEAIDTKLDTVVETLKEQREFKHTVQTAQIETWTAKEKAKTEVTAASEKAEVEITAKQKKLRSEFWWTLGRRVGAGLAAIGLILVTHFAEHCGTPTAVTAPVTIPGKAAP